MLCQLEWNRLDGVGCLLTKAQNKSTDTIFSWNVDTMCLHCPIYIKYKLTYELEVATRAHPDYPGGGEEYYSQQLACHLMVTIPTTQI